MTSFLICPVCGFETSFPHDHQPDNSGLDDGPDPRDAEIAALRAALKPFADVADDLPENMRDDDSLWESPAAMGLNAFDLRNARAVLALPGEAKA